MTSRKLMAVATVAGAMALPLAAALPAHAQSSGTQSYQANLQPVPLNGAAKDGAGGTLMLTLNGNVATITETVHGLAATFMGKPFPHVQHIHGGAQGTCPTAAADTNHDGVISTPEGQASYGPVMTTLSEAPAGTTPAQATDVSAAPSGSSFSYSRTITLDQATLNDIQAGNAVIVVHGLDPATAAPAATSEKSPLVPSLPLAATAPALCGTLTAAETSAVPSGAAQTGAGGTAGLQDLPLFVAGGVLLAGAGAFTVRRATARR